jgi:hypothetical protein
MKLKPLLMQANRMISEGLNENEIALQLSQIIQGKLGEENLLNRYSLHSGNKYIGEYKTYADMEKAIKDHNLTNIRYSYHSMDCQVMFDLDDSYESPLDFSNMAGNDRDY